MGLEPVAEEEGGLASSFKAIYRSHNLLKRSNRKDQASSSIESITRLPSLLQAYYSQRYSLQSASKPTTVNVQAYQAHRVERLVYSLQSTVEADLVIDYSIPKSITKSITSRSQRIDLQAYI